jgi:Tol biopolymer transport system component
MTKRKKRLPLVVLAVLLGCCLCGLGFGAFWVFVVTPPMPSQPPALATPGVIYAPTADNELPLPLKTWQYQPDTLLLHHEGLWEWVEADPRVALYHWRTGETQMLAIPDLSPLNRYDFAQSPDPNVIAYSDGDDIYRYDVATAQSQKVTTGGEPTFSPDGLQLAFWRGPELWALTMGTTVETLLFSAQDTVSNSVRYWQRGSFPAWSPDGGAIAFQMQQLFTISGTTDTSSRDLVVLDLATPEIFPVASISKDGYFSPVTWSPDGRLVLYVENEPYTGDSTIYLADWRANCIVGELSLDDIYSAYWSPAGDVIATATWVSTYLYFIDVQQAFGADYQNLACLP